MNHALKENDVVVVDLDPLSHGDPLTTIRAKFEILKVSDLGFEIESGDGENVVEIDAMAVAKVLEWTELLDEGGVYQSDDQGTHGYLEIWYCIDGTWRAAEFSLPELEFLDDQEQLLSPAEAALKRYERKMMTQKETK